MDSKVLLRPDPMNTYQRQNLLDDTSLKLYLIIIIIDFKPLYYVRIPRKRMQTNYDKKLRVDNNDCNIQNTNAYELYLRICHLNLGWFPFESTRLWNNPFVIFWLIALILAKSVFDSVSVYNSLHTQWQVVYSGESKSAKNWRTPDGVTKATRIKIGRSLNQVVQLDLILKMAKRKI